MSRKSNSHDPALSRKNAGKHYARLNKDRERKQKKKRILIGLGIVCAILVAVGAYFLYLNNAIRTKDEALLASLKEQASDEPFYMLLLGVDKGEERYESEGTDTSNYRADTIMLCRIDPSAVKATIVSVHRDTYVELQNGTMGKINASYSLGGPAGMVQAVGKLAGVDINHYAEIDFDAFMGIVDTIGGVEVTLPVDVYDPDYTGLNLSAGTHVLNGHDALMLSRCRHGYDEYGDGDLYRAANQRMIIASIVRKVLKSDPTTMIRAISSMAESLSTDMDLNSILALAAQMRDFDTDKDLYTGMTPTEPEVIDGVYYEILDQSAWSTMMDRVDAGQPPYSSDAQDETAGIAGSVHGLGAADGKAAESSASNTTGTSKRKAPAKIIVMGVEDGRATTIAEELEDVGYTAASEEDPSYTFDANVIVYDDAAYAEQAYAVADYLGSDYFTVMENDGSFLVTDGILIRLAGDSYAYVEEAAMYDESYGTADSGEASYDESYDTESYEAYDEYGSYEY